VRRSYLHSWRSFFDHERLKMVVLHTWHVGHVFVEEKETLELHVARLSRYHDPLQPGPRSAFTLMLGSPVFAVGA
jgi:hypothetical protein